MPDKVVHLPEPIDGFYIHPAYRPGFPVQMFSRSVWQLEVLRRSNSYRPKLVVYPSVGDPVPAFGIIERQFHVPGGSILWCVSAVGYKAGDYSPDSLDGIYIQITDNCSNLPFSEYFLCLSNFATYAQEYGVVQRVLDAPRVYPYPGLLTVEIANSRPDPAYVQVMLGFAQPCEHLITEFRADWLEKPSPMDVAQGEDT